MAAKQRDDRHAEVGEQGDEQRRALIGGQVVHALGRPGALLRVEVRPLWADYYRANVLVGADPATARVAHSYFLVTDGAGKILASTPELTRVY